MDNFEQDVPVEFECCFCTTKDFKEFTDAEGVISLPTSDFHKPVCVEMRMAANQANRDLRANQFGLLAPPIHLPTSQPQIAGAITAATGDAHAEVIFSIAGGGGVMRTPHHLPHHTANSLAPIASQSSSTSSSYGTTTSTTIALPLDTPFRYPPFITMLLWTEYEIKEESPLSAYENHTLYVTHHIRVGIWRRSMDNNELTGLYALATTSNSDKEMMSFTTT
ncbi:uncharacterized protein LOC118746516 [Rhagoletis pomonella]|uniref:uncharacterized protein LOC118746516 n=1 Tax=Rhagoletis pomonella TaxID=28610 RepID=UPI00177B618E|nr:uncharacterized protein LOC118746516 [Rhagoletis pomonella]